MSIDRDELMEEELTEKAVGPDQLLRFFRFKHLPLQLRDASRPFAELALKVVRDSPPGPERTVALRKLLEAKDANVRTFVT